MKLHLLILMMTMSAIMTAQNLFDKKSPFNKEIREEYLGNLFKECKVVYCDKDSMDDGTFIKKIEVRFLDTTMFFSAYFSSTSFTKQSYPLGIYQCDYLEMDDGGEGLKVEGKDFQKIPYLKSLLDTILREMPFIEYTGDCPGTDGLYYLGKRIRIVSGFFYGQNDINI